ncbi:unnamed protein product (macronuclear) [Paramecium tetraurelia]|uniref:Transmembrane protein n=1 Tax=Paramecium tetraurelia TaxID=5888 RepID=A0DKF6_PARTE|nr:uncharacterized protein GSPATT00017853001 [Paramecium tetraurelia]CAK83523.1 unnamed protein product [Paramecium tetraurelia]|eukprot:XP_001450920.1 hypothetical protein (macronuclear) [Paramecium tetraurelia strain d4-2]
MQFTFDLPYKTNHSISNLPSSRCVGHFNLFNLSMLISQQFQLTNELLKKNLLSIYIQLYFQQSQQWLIIQSFDFLQFMVVIIRILYIKCSISFGYRLFHFEFISITSHHQYLFGAYVITMIYIFMYVAAQKTQGSKITLLTLCKELFINFILYLIMDPTILVKQKRFSQKILNSTNQMMQYQFIEIYSVVELYSFRQLTYQKVYQAALKIMLMQTQILIFSFEFNHPFTIFIYMINSQHIIQTSMLILFKSSTQLSKYLCILFFVKYF